MIRKIKNIVFTISLSFICFLVNSQEINWEDMLKEEVEVENPVYRPVIGIGGGMMSYWGDIKNEQKNIILGQPSFKFNISQAADNKKFFRLNVMFNIGTVGANQHFQDTAEFNYSNFKTSILSLGLGLDYGFGHFFSGTKRIRPFIGAGIEFLSFDARGNLKFEDINGNEFDYYPWTDGTIRNYDQSAPIPRNSDLDIYFRDNVYETNYRLNQDYSLQTFSIPIEAGLDFSLTDRATMRFGTALCLTGTDFLDGFSPEKSFLKNDRYIHTYFTFHYDLWSDPKTILVEKLFADIEFDDAEMYVLTNDEDYDFVFDFYDECPNTPFGVTVDSLGCPFDDDDDGVPNYKDLELNTAEGAFVDTNGVTLSDDDLIALLDNSMAINHEDAFELGQNYRINKYAGIKNLTIPEKYKFVDLNGDGYVSFYELLGAIDNFFDYNSPLTADDLKDLNDFFFAQ